MEFCYFSRHYNNNVDRMEVINSLAEVITRMNSGNKADLKNPEIAVVVEVMRGFCLLSIAPNYFKYKKYNVSKIVEVIEKFHVYLYQTEKYY